jgi:TolB-like protein
MFTDMVGYTALGQRNESLSLALVEEQRKIIRPILARHNGKEIKTMGDAFLVEFPNAVDAVRCAYDIQRAIREFNFSLAPGKRIHLRVGVHVGEVVEAQGDISGDAVNVASRIEPLAEDGGVCITRQVYDHVQNKFELAMASLGVKPLKNVSVPPEVFKVVMPWDEASESTSSVLDAKRIAVLPFANMSSDPENEYFADGITEEMISTLSGIGGLSVISRTSVMGYKGTSKKLGEIGKELAAGTILEGSVRRAGSKIRVTAQLIDVSKDKHLWAQTYDRELLDIFAIQSDIAQRIAESARVSLLEESRARMERRPTRNMAAYESYLKGISFLTQIAEHFEDSLGYLNDSVRYLEDAIRKDPDFSLPYAALGNLYLTIAGEVVPLGEGFEKAEPLIEKALTLDPYSSDSHTAKGNFELQCHLNYGLAEEEMERGVELGPGDAKAHFWHGMLLLFTFRTEPALKELRMAHELDPLSFLFSQWLAFGLEIASNYDEAIKIMERSTGFNPQLAWHQLELARLYFRLGRPEDARQRVRQARSAKLTTYEETFLATDLAIMGRTAEAREVLSKIEGKRPEQYVSPTHMASAYCALGEADKALELLEEDFAVSPVAFLFYNQLPDFDSIRSHPRFVSLVERLNLPKKPV